MEIILNITEDSKVELVKDTCEAVQGENNVTILKINFPSTIKGYSIDNYTKQIEFGECKELGECKKFLDVVEGDTYKLCSICTQFEKLMIQFTLKNVVDEAEPIVWKTIPFALEFCESINAENTKEVQATLLNLNEILTEWENYIKNNTFRVVSKVGDMPTADAESLGKVIFYLGVNSTSPYTLTYGHYYKCNYVNKEYEWTDLTQDPSLEGVANGIREISNNQTMQLWVNTKEALKNEVIQPNTIYIPEDHDIKETFDEILTEIANDNDGQLKIDNTIISRKKLIMDTPISNGASNSAATETDITLNEEIKDGDILEIEWQYGVAGYVEKDRITIRDLTGLAISHANAVQISRMAIEKTNSDTTYDEIEIKSIDLWLINSNTLRFSPLYYNTLQIPKEYLQALVCSSAGKQNITINKIYKIID